MQIISQHALHLIEMFPSNEYSYISNDLISEFIQPERQLALIFFFF